MQFLIRIFLQLCVAVLMLIPIQINHMSTTMPTVIRVVSRFGSLIAVFVLLFVGIMLGLEALGILFKRNINFQQILMLILGKGLYPQQRPTNVRKIEK